MHRRRLLALTGSLFAGALAGCSAPTPRTAVESPEPGVVADIDDATLEALVSDTNAFSLALYRETTEESPTENGLVSPLSVTITLAMAYAGAREDTRSQMRETFNYTASKESLHPAFNALQRELNDRGDEIDPAGLPEKFDTEDDPVPFELSLVNAVWGQSGFPFKEAYLDVLADHYGGGLREVDYQTDPERARQTINEWVADRTEDRIDELLPEGALTTLTRLVLTNAVYFRANWQDPFEPDDTEPAPFTPIEGPAVHVPMMQKHEPVPYTEVAGAKAIDLPYLGGAVSMLFVLPPAGEFEAFEDAFDMDTFSTIVDSLERQEGSVAIPKFEFGKGLQLKPTLETLGMTAAFDPQEADFSGMADLDQSLDRLFIDQVYHDTYISVDETGTEAAAATGAVAGLTSAPEEQFEFVADRPFLIAIRDRPTGALLFLGRVVDAGAAQ